MKKRKPMTERQIEQHLASQIKKRGGLSRKFNSNGQRGVPDRLCIWPGGRIHFVELKTEKGVTTPQQQYEHERLSNLGCQVFTLHGKGEVDLYLEQMANPINDEFWEAFRDRA